MIRRDAHGMHTSNHAISAASEGMSSRSIAVRDEKNVVDYSTYCGERGAGDMYLAVVQVYSRYRSPNVDIIMHKFCRVSSYFILRNMPCWVSYA